MNTARRYNFTIGLRLMMMASGLMMVFSTLYVHPLYGAAIILCFLGGLSFSGGFCEMLFSKNSNKKAQWALMIIGISLANIVLSENAPIWQVLLSAISGGFVLGSAWVSYLGIKAKGK